MSADKQYRNALDGLRALAIVAVIINHFNHALLPSGYLGVDVFYVISGFVITQSLQNHPEPGFAPFIVGFLSRRVKRLLPALIAYVVLIGLAICLVDPSAESSLLTGMFALIGLSNLLLIYKATDYFAPSSDLNPFTHTWSLGVEEQFYLLYPLLFWAMTRWLPMRGQTRSLGWALTIFSFLSLSAFITLYPGHQTEAYFLMPTRIWELGYGALLYLSLNTTKRLNLRPRAVSGSLILTLMLSTFMAPQSLAVEATICAVFLTGGLILAFETAGGLTTIFSMAPFARIGKISYSLYLWHWGILTLGRWTLGITLWTSPVLLLLMFSLAGFSYRFIEQPFRRSGASPQKTLLIAALSVALALGAVVFAYLKHDALFSGNRETVDNGVSIKSVTPRSHIKAYNCQFESPPKGLNTSEKFDHFQKQCVSPQGSGTFSVMISGDSHALDLLPIVDDLSDRLSAPILFTSQPGCKVPAFGNQSAACDLPLLLVQERMRRDPTPLVLVLRENLSPRALTPEFDAHISALKRFLDAMQAMGVRVVMVAPSPKASMAVNGGICYEQPFRPHWAISESCSAKSEPRGEQLARRNEYVAELERLKVTYPLLSIFDPFEILCARVGDSCTLSHGSDFFYRDQSHLTIAGVHSLTDALASNLQGILNEAHSKK